MYDKLAELCNAQAITVDAYSEKSYNLGTARNVATGRPLYVVMHVTTTFAGGTSMNVNVVTSANANLSSHAIENSSREFLQAELVAGKVFVIPVAKLEATNRQYLGLYFDQTDDFTAGAVTCYLTETPPSNFGN